MLVGNVSVDLVNHESAISLIMDSLSASDPLAVTSADLDHIHHFANDESWACRPPAVSVNGPSQGLRWLTLLDGVSLVRTANALTGRRWPRLSGSDLIYPILESAAVLGVRVGFLGGAVETHSRMRELVGERVPAIRIVGTWAPTGSELTDRAASERIAAEISDAEVDILVVGLAKPRQEEWITRFGPATGARVLLAFGTVEDFFAGRARRAPEQLAEAGVEWAARLMLEPRRLREYYPIHGLPAFLQLTPRARVVEGAMAASPHDERGRFVSADTHADVAVVVVTYNSASDIPLLIDDLRVAAHHRRIRLIVVDNQSSDGTVELIHAHDDIMLVESGGNLGYGGGMNAGVRLIGHCDAVLMLNPDLRLAPDAITRLFEAINDNQIGAVVPLMLDDDGATYPSLRREPSLTRAIGDALFGSKMWRNRPAFLSELDYRPASYVVRHDVDWATGAALLVPAAVAREVGEWWDEFPIYSEETDYFRRIREIGRRIRFEPAAVVRHRRGGSGASPGLAALMAVNRIRYVERYHGREYTALFRAVVALAEGLRSYDPVHRRSLAFILNRRRWEQLPQITKPIVAP
jgi:exopolysaccharide biosynthesis WecB/TagA/CpsF family protein